MSEAGPRAWSARRQWRTVALAAALLAATVLMVWVSRRSAATDESVLPAPASPPGTFRASPQQLKTLSVETVHAYSFTSEERTEGKIAVDGDHATPVFSPYSGRIIRVIAALGDTVKAGAPLATIEASEFVQAQNDLRGAAVQVKFARINEARKHALFDVKGGSLQDWQSAQAELTAAENALNSARNRLRILGRSNSDIGQLESTEAQSPLATLVAPIAGVVVDRQVGPGQYLQSAGATPLFTIADPASVWLLANVRESDAGLVRVGQPIEVRVLAYPTRVFKARLTYVGAAVDAATHRLAVRAVIENRDGALKPEMFANFRILTSEASDSPAVPEAAVVYEGDSAHVWVLGGEGVLSLRAIRTGRSSDGLIEVTDGLKSGEQVVTKGPLFIDQAAAPATP